MKLQGRDLSMGIRGEDVKLLQSELYKLGYVIPVEEIDRQFFDRGTNQAVLDFQRKHGLETTGTVDEITAKLINDELGPTLGDIAAKLDDIQIRTLGGINANLDEQASRLVSIGTKLNEQTGELGNIGAKMGVQTNVLGGINASLGQQTNSLVSIGTKLSEQTDKLSNIDTKMGVQTNVLGGINASLGQQTNSLVSIGTKLSEQTDKLGNIDTKMGVQTNVLGGINASLDEHTNKLEKLVDIDSKFGEQTVTLHAMDTKLGEQTTVIREVDAKLGEQRLVGGQVRSEDLQPFPAVLIRAFHVEDDRMLRLGEDTTDAEGRYTIRYELLPGADSINLRVTVFDANGKPLRDSNVIRGAKPLEVIDLIVPGVNIKYRVEGKVASRISASVGGLRVVIVDKGVGGDAQLTTDDAHTDDGGAYQAFFSDSDVRRRGKAQPDLQARVFAGNAFLGASDVHYNASKHETLNVLLEDKAASALPSEYDVLTGALARQFNSKLKLGDLGNLKETDDQQDITYLANKTGWDARAVALAALADQFSAQTMDTTGALVIPQTFFYALFRAGSPQTRTRSTTPMPRRWKLYGRKRRSRA